MAFYNPKTRVDEYVFHSGMKITRELPLVTYDMQYGGMNSYSYVQRRHSTQTKFSKIKHSISYSMLPDEYQKYQSVMGQGHIGDIIIENSQLDTLQGLPKTIDGGLSFHDHVYGLFSLINIHKTLNCVTGTITMPLTIRQNILGLLLIKGLQNAFIVKFTDFFRYVDPKDIAQLRQALEIINLNLQNRQDVLECQEQLITDGLNQFAKL